MKKPHCLHRGYRRSIDPHVRCEDCTLKKYGFLCCSLRTCRWCVHLSKKDWNLLERSRRRRYKVAPNAPSSHSSYCVRSVSELESNFVCYTSSEHTLDSSFDSSLTSKVKQGRNQVRSVSTSHTGSSSGLLSLCSDDMANKKRVTRNSADEPEGAIAKHMRKRSIDEAAVPAKKIKKSKEADTPSPRPIAKATKKSGSTASRTLDYVTEQQKFMSMSQFPAQPFPPYYPQQMQGPGFPQMQPWPGAQQTPAAAGSAAQMQQFQYPMHPPPQFNPYWQAQFGGQQMPPPEQSQSKAVASESDDDDGEIPSVSQQSTPKKKISKAQKVKIVKRKFAEKPPPDPPSSASSSSDEEDEDVVPAVVEDVYEDVSDADAHRKYQENSADEEYDPRDNRAEAKPTDYKTILRFMAETTELDLVELPNQSLKNSRVLKSEEFERPDPEKFYGLTTASGIVSVVETWATEFEKLHCGESKAKLKHGNLFHCKSSRPNMKPYKAGDARVPQETMRLPDKHYEWAKQPQSRVSVAISDIVYLEGVARDSLRVLSYVEGWHQCVQAGLKQGWNPHVMAEIQKTGIQANKDLNLLTSCFFNSCVQLRKDNFITGCTLHTSQKMRMRHEPCANLANLFSAPLLEEINKEHIEELQVKSLSARSAGNGGNKSRKSSSEFRPQNR